MMEFNLPVGIDIGACEQLLLDLVHISKQEEINVTDLGVDILAQARVPWIRRYRTSIGCHKNIIVRK